MDADWLAALMVAVGVVRVLHSGGTLASRCAAAGLVDQAAVGAYRGIGIDIGPSVPSAAE
jgi:hypothetical protein